MLRTDALRISARTDPDRREERIPRSGDISTGLSIIDDYINDSDGGSDVWAGSEISGPAFCTCRQEQIRKEGCMPLIRGRIVAAERRSEYRNNEY